MGAPIMTETAPAPAGPAPRRRWLRRPFVTGVALLAAVAAMLVAALLVTRDRTGGERVAAEPGEALAAVDAARAFVQRERGLAFARPVPVRVLSEADFDRFDADVAGARAERGRVNAAKTQGVLEALGLLPAGSDLLADLRALGGSGGRVARYDLVGGTLAVRAVSPTPYVRVQVVRELAYALLDQRFELDRPRLAQSRDGSAFGFTALVAGDVYRLVATYRASLPDGEQAQVAEEESRVGGGPAGRPVPPVVSQFATLPNRAGPALVEAIVTGGGQPALDRAYADPPRTAAQVLFPDRYLRHTAAVPVPAPAAGGPATDEGQFGVDHLLYLLGDSPTAYAALEGWAGDRYVAWRDGDRSCLRVAFAGTTPRGADDLADALRLWAAGRPAAASVSRAGGRVVLSACGSRP